MIAIVDFGAGNLRSVEKAFAAVGASPQVTAEPQRVRAAERVVLPGVGAFADGMRGLEERGLLSALQEVCARGTPLLGICLGMQLLFERSEEHGDCAGLGLLRGAVRRLPEGVVKVPHTGWNQLEPAGESPLLADVAAGSFAFFNHGYFCDAEQSEDVLAWTQHGIRFPSVVGRGALLGMQFHPEKSQHLGLALIRNFLERCR